MGIKIQGADIDEEYEVELDEEGDICVWDQERRLIFYKNKDLARRVAEAILETTNG